MNIWRRLPWGPVLLLAVLAWALIGCGGQGDDADSEAESTPVMAVTAARVAVAPMSQELRLLGVTAAFRHTMLRAPSAGMVVGLELQSGDDVRRNQIVARVISQEDLAAQAGLAVARKLQPDSAAELSRSVEEYAHNPGVAVVVPQAAVVAKRLVSSGQTVAYLDPLVDLIDPTSMYVDAAVPIEQASRLRPGMSATITSPLAPGKTFAGRVAAILPTSGSNQVTSSCRIDFTSRNVLRIAGVAVQASVVTDYVPRALVIPKAALFQSAATSTYYAFTVGSDGLAHRTDVTPGIRGDSLVQITSGLKPGQIVITSGGYAVSDGLKVTASIQPALSTISPETASAGSQ